MAAIEGDVSGAVSGRGNALPVRELWHACMRLKAAYDPRQVASRPYARSRATWQQAHNRDDEPPVQRRVVLGRVLAHGILTLGHRQLIGGYEDGHVPHRRQLPY